MAPVVYVMSLVMVSQGDSEILGPFFAPPALFAGDLGNYRSPLTFDDGSPVKTLLGYRDRVAMTNRSTHSPTPESNEQIYAFFDHFRKTDDVRRSD
ncbi:MAG: hypothetical protein KBI32_10405 [Phycisphaerae bacterium]|nr:hypothetical protein [Phycisphaerae bacterium]